MESTKNKCLTLDEINTEHKEIIALARDLEKQTRALAELLEKWEEKTKNAHVYVKNQVVKNMKMKKASPEDIKCIALNIVNQLLVFVSLKPVLYLATSIRYKDVFNSIEMVTEMAKSLFDQFEEFDVLVNSILDDFGVKDKHLKKQFDKFKQAVCSIKD